ncbi:MAG: TRAP transporter small permease [Cyclobacteriaceae bacterium]|nr:TRAP transporter small permease [Cyclobacteriaceae bacterium]
MKKFDYLFIRFLKYGTLSSTLVLIGIVCVQIYARFFMENAPSWTEELSRMVFIYTVSFASGLAFRQGYFIQLDLWHSSINSRFSWALDTMSSVTALILFILLLAFGIQFLVMGMVERSPGLAIPMAWSFGAMVLLGFSITWFAFRKVIAQFRH